jgi:hypothetical protein
MDAYFHGNAPGRTGETQQKGREYPVCQRPRALVQQGRGEVVEGALAVLAPVAFTPGPIVVLAPRIDIVTVAPGTLEWAIFPPQCVDVGLTVFGAEELVDMREYRHEEESPGSRELLGTDAEILALVASFYPSTNRDKLSDRRSAA